MERADIRLSTLKPKKTSKKQSLFESLKKLLEDNQIKFQLYKHEPVFTSEQAAKVKGTKVKQGAKALVMFADKKPVLIVLSAAKKIETKKFKKQFGIKDLKMAEALAVKKISGVEIGAIPPFGNLMDLSTYVDKSLGENKEIAFNAGMHTRSVKMGYKDYCRLAKPFFGQFSK